MLRITLSIFVLIPLWSSAQYKGVSYELRNEIGTYILTSKTFSHRIDNEEGITYMTDKTGEKSLYHFDEFLNGYVGLSNDGRTIVHVQSEKNSEPLSNLKITMYRDGKKFDTAELGKLLKYELDDVEKRQALPKSGWLRNDSLLHKMASNSFYITDDKAFVSIEGPKLQVFDLNQMFHIYTGNGANHFTQNYYSIPNLPFRTEFTSSEYFPKKFPKMENGEDFEAILAKLLDAKTAIPEEATFRVEIEIKLNDNTTIEVRKATVFSTKANELDEERTESLKTGLSALKMETSLLPPNHPAWIFSENFWLK